MNRDEEKKFWFDFVKMYKTRPVLWKSHSEIYKNKKLKKLAYQQMAFKLRRIYPEADVIMVKRKINNIRSCYRREMFKVMANREAMARDVTVHEYKPTWWLYDQLGFLDTLENYQNLKKEDESMEEQEINDEMLNEEVDEEEKEMEEKEMEKKYDSDVGSLPSINEDELDFEETQNSSLQRIDFLDVTSSNTKTTNLNQTQYQPVDSEADIYGRGWAIQYQDLSADQRIYAKKAIEDIFFEAKLGTLHRNSVKINEDSKVEQRKLHHYDN